MSGSTYLWLYGDNMERLTKFLQHSYLSLLARVTPPEVDPNSEEADDIARLLNLALLGVPVIIGFVAEFAFFGIWQLALSLGLAGVVMIASPWIYWKTASLSVARESFLISLFVLICTNPCSWQASLLLAACGSSPCRPSPSCLEASYRDYLGLG